MRQAFPLTLLSEILDESMTQREVLTEARAGLIPALRKMRLELVNLHTINVVERDDKLYVAIAVDVYGGCRYCGGTIPDDRRTLCGDERCLAELRRDIQARKRVESVSPALRRDGEWSAVANRRARVRELAGKGLDTYQIAVRVLGGGGASARRTVQRDLATLRARGAA